MGFKGPGLSSAPRDEFGLPSLNHLPVNGALKGLDDSPKRESPNIEVPKSMQSNQDPFKDKMKGKVEETHSVSQNTNKVQVGENLEKPSWSSVVKNHSHVENLVFDYHPLEAGATVVTPPPPSDVLKKGMEKFQLCLVGTFSKGTIPLSKMIENARNVWESKGLTSVSQKDSHTFCLSFVRRWK
ncbi:hypothetical protein ACET3Z_021305 [Daucus carota]